MTIAALAFCGASAARADEPPGGPIDGDELILVPGLEELEAVEALDQADSADIVDERLLVRSTARLGLPLAEAPGIVTVIRASDLRAMGARTLYDALRYAPELDVTRDAFGFYHVAVRGRKVDPEVLIRIDGHRLNDFYDGRILYEIPISMVERIEILRGPGSALYGTNAFAGVISIYTRRRTDGEAQVSATTSGGDRDELAPSSFWVAGHGGVDLGARFRAYAALEVAHERGPRLLIPEDSLTRNRMDPDTGESQSRSCDNQPEDTCPDTAFSSLPRLLARANANVESRLAVLTDGDRLTAGAHAIYVDKGPFIGEYDTLTPDSQLRTAQLLADARYEVPLNVDRSLGLSFGSSIDLAAVDREIQVAPDGFKELVAGNSELFPDGQLKHVDYSELVLRQDLRLRWARAQRNSLVVGAEVEHTRMPHFGFETNYDDSGRHYDELGDHLDLPLAQDGASRTVVSVYAEDLYSAPGGVRLIGGGRFDHYSDFGSAFSPRAGAIWRREGLSLKLFYGWAFRAPTFQELYDQTGRIDLGQFVGNPGLDASRIQTIEGAMLYVLSLDDLLLEITATGSRSSITESIDRAPLSGLNNTYHNTSDVESNAASFEVRVDLLRRRLSLFANGSWQSATSEYAYAEPSQGLDISSHTELRNVPRLRLNAGARARVHGRVTAGLLAEVGGQRENNERTPLEAQHFFDYPSYAMLQAYVQADGLWRGTFARLDVRNVTNTRINDEPFRPNRMPLGIPRDRFRIDATVGMDF